MGVRPTATELVEPHESPRPRTPRVPPYQELLTLFRGAARALAEQRGQQQATLVTFFCPQWVAKRVVRRSAVTLWRWFKQYPELREQMAVRPHYGPWTDNDGATRTRIDGMVWAIRMKPGRGEVRVPLEALKWNYRNLDADIAAGRVEKKQAVKESPTTGLGGLEGQDLLLAWALGAPDVTPVVSDPCTLPEAFAEAEWNPDIRNTLAHLIATRLRDRHSLRYWLGQVHSWSSRGRLQALKGVIERSLTDGAEGFARSPAALAVARLKPPARHVATVA